VLAPIALAVASDAATPDLAASVRFGSAGSGPVALYVRFDSKAYSEDTESAFLLLDPESHSTPSEDIELEVGRARRAWQGSDFSWAGQPGFTSPVARGVARTHPALPIRIDVTELVRFIAAHPPAAFGFVVRAREKRPFGVSVATGMYGGSAPRLDIYVGK
jgi:hypothetical protein